MGARYAGLWTKNSLMVTGQRRNLFVFCRVVLLFSECRSYVILVHRGNCCLFLVGSYVEGGEVYGPAISMASAYVYSMQLLFVKLKCSVAAFGKDHHVSILQSGPCITHSPVLYKQFSQLAFWGQLTQSKQEDIMHLESLTP